MEAMILIYIILIVLIIIIAPFLKKAKTDYIGRVGENTTLSIVKSISRDFKVLQNLYIPTVKGNTTEIDTIAITSRGIFVFETKNYSGTIYGNTTDKNWRAEVYKKTNEFYNPILQNETHIKYLKRTIAVNVPFFSIIVLSDRCTIGDIDVGYSGVKVVKMSGLHMLVVSLYNHNPMNVPEILQETIYKKLIKYTNPSEEVIRKHKEYVRSKH